MIENYKTILGEFDPTQLVSWVDKENEQLKTNIYLEEACSYHEREHYFQTISSTFGYLFSHVNQSEKLYMLKSLIDNLKNIGCPEFKHPILNWFLTENKSNTKIILQNFINNFISYEMFEYQILCPHNDNEMSNVIYNLLNGQKINIAPEVDERYIGALSILEGLAQLKTYFYINQDFRNLEDKEKHRTAIDINWNILNTNPYNQLFKFASNILEVNLFNKTNLLKFFDLIVTAGEIAMQIPFENNSDPMNFQPAFRFRRIIEALKKKNKLVNVENLDSYIQELIVKEFGWQSTASTINGLIKAYRIDEDKLEYSFVNQSFLKALKIRAEYPELFQFSFNNIKYLRNEFILPQEHNQNNKERIINTFYLPYTFRPAIIEQLLLSDKLKCPLNIENNKFSIKSLFYQSRKIDCDFNPENRKECTYNLLLNDLGLVFEDSKLVFA